MHGMIHGTRIKYSTWERSTAVILGLRKGSVDVTLANHGQPIPRSVASTVRRVRGGTVYAIVGGSKKSCRQRSAGSSYRTESYLITER